MATFLVRGLSLTDDGAEFRVALTEEGLEVMKRGVATWRSDGVDAEDS
ncbi:MAG: hypothetical protein U9N84_04570 [Actinomycetota bacterium]|nr:hypothetical protein [Actinomycetota bacterium]